MRVKTLQVVWHSQKPIYSVDFHPSGVLATGGGDKDVKVSASSSLDARSACCLTYYALTCCTMQLWKVSIRYQLVLAMFKQ